MTTRQDLHQLVDELPESAVAEAARLLTALRADEDPLLKAFMEAPIDDEPLTEEEIAAIEEGREDVRAGRVLSHEETRRLLLGDQ